ncbi:hypothetical protein F4677DRAFT_464638 [Hypoxylon crocopeplum]|nr:hypothetical protein F4677DRAFT_464638 [Hypoxylon crocopeplum]
MALPRPSVSSFGAWFLLSLLGLSTVMVLAAPGSIKPYYEDDDDADIQDLFNLSARADNPNWKSYYPLPMIQAKGTTIIPSPQELLQIIKPEVATSTCLFYSALGNGVQAQRDIRKWYRCNIGAPFVDEDGITHPAEDPITETTPRSPIVAGRAGNPTELAVYQALMKSVDVCNVPQLRDSGGFISASASADGFYSQAFAEACTGVVYWFGPDNIDPTHPAPDSVWTLYELPALTSGGKVTNIAYVDKNLGVEFDDDTDQLTNPRIIWSSGDPPGTIAAPETPSTSFRYFRPSNPYGDNGADPMCLHQ